jgi:glutamate 5-kinase
MSIDRLSRLTDPAAASRVVFKVGSALLVGEDGAPRRDWLAALVAEIAAARMRGQEVIVVSSGAIALGARKLGLARGGRGSLADAQAAAAVGQIALAGLWAELLAAHGLIAAQVLLTLEDLEDRRRYLNVTATLGTWLMAGAVPVINENDTVATEEIRFGDNDRLAARVGQAAGASAVVLLSDIDGLYDADPRKGGDPGARFISEVAGPDDLAGVIAGQGSSLGTGGMASKLSSALLAADAGVPVLLAAATDAAAALADASVGTVFAPRPTRMSARRFWVRYAAESAGALTLDEGAVRAVVTQRRSLLPAGITGLSGKFFGGDVVELRGPDAEVVARGVVAYDATELAGMIGRSTSELAVDMRRPAVHADDLVAV